MATQNGGHPNWIMYGLSCFTHLLFIGATLYIFSIVSVGYSIFLWHPTCMAVGCGFLMTEAVFGISGEHLLSSKVSRSCRIKIHWILHILGLGFMVVGFGAIMVDNGRYYLDPSHFLSDHGKLGLATFITTLVVALGGFLNLYAGSKSERSRLSNMNLIHSCSGIICIILLLASLITGVYMGGPNTGFGRAATAAAYVIGGFIVLFKPISTTWLKIRGLFT